MLDSKTRTRLAWFLGLIAVMAVWPRGPAYAQGCPFTFTNASTSGSLRIMTLNAAIQVYPGDSEDQYELDFEDRARAIAALILADSPDVVALQEVNADAIKKVFIEELDGTYPSFVEKLDENDLDNDSGLMMFSKFRFQDPLGSFHGSSHVESENQGIPAFINSIVFSDANGGDWWANKGVGIARILNECNGNAPFHVAFTHMQASHADDSDPWLATKMETRQKQLAEIRDLLEIHVTPDRMRFEPVFLVGDLNIDGNLFASPPPFFMTPSGGNGVVIESHTEWLETFDSANLSPPFSDMNGGFYSCAGGECTYDGSVFPSTGTFFTDAWAFGTSPLDPGQTNPSLFEPAPNEGARKDYVLHNRPKRSLRGGAETDMLCLQHVVRGFSPLLGAGIGGDLSDHVAVTADFNRPASRCSPHPRKADRSNPLLGPEEVSFDLEDPQAPNFKDVEFPGFITFPGSLQWYRINQAASYEIEVTGANVGYRVYQGADLSNPMMPFNGECSEDPGGHEPPSFKCKFKMESPPYFVQVFASATSADSDGVPDRTRAAVPYDIGFHRYDCSSIDSACFLEAGKQIGPYRWPVGPLNASQQPPDDNAMFFRFDTELARDLGSPTITFLLDHDFPVPGEGQPDVLTMQLVDETGALVCVPPLCPLGDGLRSQTPGWADSDGDQMMDRLAIAEPGTLPGDGSWTEEYFLKVLRHPNYQLQDDRVFVTYKTDLTYFRPLELFCGEERTDLGDDDIEARFVFDSLAAIIAFMGDKWSDGHSIAQAGSGSSSGDLPFVLDGAFLTLLKPEIFEDVLDGDDFFFESPNSGNKIQPLSADVIAPKDVPVTDVHIYSDEPKAEDAEYWYELNFQLTHERPACRPLIPNPAIQGDCIAPRTCQNGACKL